MFIRILLQPLIPKLPVFFSAFIYPPDKVFIQYKIGDIKQAEIFHTIVLIQVSSAGGRYLLVKSNIFFGELPGAGYNSEINADRHTAFSLWMVSWSRLYTDWRLIF